MFSTCSVLPSRKGLSNIEELSAQKLDDSKLEELMASWGQKSGAQTDLLSDDSSDSEDSTAEYAKEKKKTEKKLRRSKSRIQFFEKEFSLKNKGAYQVWKSKLNVLGRKIPLYLHAVNDSKVVYRISTLYGANPAVKMMITDDSSGKKLRTEVETSAAQKAYRKWMGGNDQSDAKRAKIKLSAKYFRRWPQKLVAKTLEDCITNAYLNYLLDPGCEIEPWPVFLHNLVQELLDSGEDLRCRKRKIERFRRMHHPRSNKRPRAGSDETLKIGERCPGGKHIASLKFLQKKDRTQQCAFCKRLKAMYKCRSCNMHLCLQPPKEISGRSFPANGTMCYQRFHGFSKYPK